MEIICVTINVIFTGSVYPLNINIKFCLNDSLQRYKNHVGWTCNHVGCTLVFFKEKLKTDIDTNDILIDTSFYC